jgi:hypothetical protein
VQKEKTQGVLKITFFFSLFSSFPKNINFGSGEKKSPDRKLIDPGISHFYPQDLARHHPSAKVT